MNSAGMNEAAEDGDPISTFFAQLAKARHVPTFERNSATLRFDVEDDDAGPIGERWYVAVRGGDVTINHRNASADAVIRLRRPHLEAMVTGRINATAAYLRGILACEGSMAALIMFQRCLPGPPGSTGRVAPISSAAVMAERRAA
jgi:putative sterol carrier protein